MNGLFLLALFLIFSSAANAQDERYYRRIYSNELTDKPSEVIKTKVVVKSPNYRLDLNRDGIDEIIKTEKRDGIDYFIIRDHFGRTLMEQKLSTIGSHSNIYRIQLKTISDKVDALIIHFYEGAIDSTQFNASARLYFLTINKRDLKKMHFFQGPHHFIEKEKLGDKYSIRRFTVNAVDLNQDGSKEVIITYNNISRVFKYVAEGVWQRL
jgi:hypothetical protein